MARLHTETIPTSTLASTARVVDGFVTTQTDHQGITGTFTRAYTVTGVTLTATDGLGNTTTTHTDLAGRSISSTDAVGNSTTTVYDEDSDQPSVITNAQGRTSCYKYDLRGRKVAEWGTAIQSPRGLGESLDKRAAFAPKGRGRNGVRPSHHIPWSSEYNDSELGLVYYNYRHYNPADGRWTGRDPLAEGSSANVYCAVYNNPLISQDQLGLYVILCFAYAESKIIGIDSSNPKHSITIDDVFSGNGLDVNNPASQHKTDHGPLLEGEYWIGNQYIPKGHLRDAAEGGGYNWYRLCGDNGKGGKSYESIPVKNPSTGEVVCRGGFNLHTGRASDGCVTVWSEIAPGEKNYPQSEDYDKLSQFIEKAGEPKFVNPRKSTDAYMGVMYVRKCLKDCKKALNNH